MRAIHFVSGAVLTLALPAAGQAGVGENYGSRDPVACPQVEGAGPTLDEAVELFRCTNEIEASHLFLVDDVRLQIGKSRPFQDGDNYPEIDRALAVFPIRGAWTEHQCTNIKTFPGAAPASCRVFDKTNGSGICYRTTFGDWRCQMSGASANLRPGWFEPPR
ncbi:hypothetical protein FQ775_22455 [Nitratireductor mangrovi]|uniref:Uncharacterized protein n=1 Tax=Nitratireductor mangrovi TaxID=2599600 RepID=A0A5B8L4T2_9HYPH|nr:hypothetical protein [Nitratireductor mangrovi]QDZ02904.1 hypothetical protein FQ775_22455 [Nitratireductor mangrovi]